MIRKLGPIPQFGDFRSTKIKNPASRGKNPDLQVKAFSQAYFKSGLSRIMRVLLIFYVFTDH